MKMGAGMTEELLILRFMIYVFQYSNEIATLPVVARNDKRGT
jgi:hypothetical protein